MRANKNDPPPYLDAAADAATLPARTNGQSLGFGRRLWFHSDRWQWRRFRLVSLLCIVFALYTRLSSSRPNPNAGTTVHGLSIKRLEEDLANCNELHAKPVDPVGLHRESNARFIEGHEPTLIVNASVWSGEPAAGQDPRLESSYAWVTADVLLDRGLIRKVEKDLSLGDDLPSDVIIYNALGRPLTSGIIDMHSHAGVHSLPTLHGNEDVSELSTNITPYIRSIDGIQPTDKQIQVIKSGGVTTSLILPGSSNNIGGEAFVIKHAVGPADGRNVTSVADMLADPDRTWRYMKMACGENAKHVHGRAGERGPTSRLGESWELRRAFERASSILREQDDWCNLASEGLDRVKTYIPLDLEWEALVAVLRGQVQVHVHCYTVPDLEAFVGHSNEFQFPIRAFHHAHQSYLVPEILKRAWGDRPPASALFADNMWYKAEAAVGSEHAGKYLYDNGLVPTYVSDNPILNAQHVVFEASKGYKYGLPYHAALAAVTSAPAENLGLGNRLGKVKPGFDADVVVWDSDPLSVGATPVQVWVDGTAQFSSPVELEKPLRWEPLKRKDLPGIVGEPVSMAGDIIVTGISKILLDTGGEIENDEPHNVVISNGEITYIGLSHAEMESATLAPERNVIHLKDAYLTPAYVAFGSTLGLNAIESEKATDNGADGGTFSRAIDGLSLDTEKLHVSHRYGVTRAISAPKFARENTHHGTSVGFQTGARNSMEDRAVFAEDAAVHYTLDMSAKSRGSTPSISSAVGELRDKLLSAIMMRQKDRHSDGGNPYTDTAFLQRVVAGELPLAITVHSADAIAAVLRMKEDVEKSSVETGNRVKLRLVIVGGAEAHILANELAASRVGVVLAPFQSFGVSWDQRRALTGAPLLNNTAVDVLFNAGVTTAIGLEEDWIVRDLGLLAGIAHANSGGRIGEKDALGFIGGNIYKMLGLKGPEWRRNFVIHEGNPLEIDSKVRVVSDGSGTPVVY